MKHTKSLKTLAVFAGGLALGLGIFLVTNAYTIQTNIANAVQYIARTVVTTDGSNTSTVLVDLNTGSNSDVYIAKKLGIGKMPVSVLDINGTGSFSNSVISNGTVYASGLNIQGNTNLNNLTVNGSLTVNGNGTFSGNLVVTGGYLVVSSNTGANCTITGAIILSGSTFLGCTGYNATWVNLN